MVAEALRKKIPLLWIVFSPTNLQRSLNSDGGGGRGVEEEDTFLVDSILSD